MAISEDDLRNNDPAVELASAAYGITDSLHHDDTPYFLNHALRKLAKARGLRGFPVKQFGGHIFELFRLPFLRQAVAGLQGEELQIAFLATGGKNGDEPVRPFPPELLGEISPVLLDGLERLKLTLAIVPRRRSLDDMWVPRGPEDWEE